MAREFSLDAIREGVGKRTAELNRDAEPHSVEYDRPDRTRPFSFEQDDYDRTEAPKDDMRKYWRQFETTPIVRKPITSFASQVTEPGYYIEARKLEQSEVEDLGQWLKKAAIIEGQPGKDFRLLAKKAIIQREVRGTALVEKAPHKDDEDRVAGLKLINPEVCEAVTRPQQNILIAPEDGDRYPDAPDAETGGKAAWLQDVVEAREVDWGMSDRINRGMMDDDDDLKIGFRRDEIIPLTRDADVGEVFGTSRIESVSQRIEGIKQKLDDNDKAIESKAYPLWVFMFGDPETTGVWDSDMIDEFMSAHDMENFHPGMKQGVRGDVSIETISGEVADIAEYLNFDIQWIMASMPMPMFALGSFAGQGATVGQVAGVAQQQDVNRQIKEARMELEEEFTPILQEIAKQKGIDEERAKSIRLRIGNPNDPGPEVRRSQQVIRYVSDAKGGQGGIQNRQEAPRGNQQQQSGNTPAGGLDVTDSPNTIGKGESPSSIDNPTPDQPIAGVNKDENPFVDIKVNEGTTTQSANEQDAWDASRYAELRQLAGIADESKSTISADVSNVFLKARDRTLNRVERNYTENPQHTAFEYDRIANKALDTAITETNLRQRSRDILREEITDVAEQYGDHRSPFTQSQNASFFAQSLVNGVRDAAEEMLRRARVHIRNGVASGEDWSEVRQRIEEEYNDERLEERADLIAHMELKNAVETTKLQEFEANDDIVGVRVHNPDASTRITSQLHGAEAFFDEREEIDNQIAEAADEDALRQGFDPLPRTPPYHFQDTTTLKPIYGDDR